MTGMSTQNRIQPGVPTGGQFAAAAHGESELELVSPQHPHAHQSPAEIDDELAKIYDRLYTVRRQIAQVVASIKSMQRSIDPTYRFYRAEDVPRMAQSVEKAEDQREDLVETAEGIQDEMSPYKQEFDRRGGWTRAFLDDNAGGCVHSSMQCRTCFPSTEFTWITEMSGHAESEIVEAAGEIACTVCYPSAPPTTRSRPTTIEAPARRAARLEREAAVAVKAAKAAKDGICNPDGSELREISEHLTRVNGELIQSLRPGNVIKTEVAARRRALSDMFDLAWYGDGHPTAPAWRANADRCIAAVASKTGQSAADLVAEMDKKVAAKMRREGR